MKLTEPSPKLVDIRRSIPKECFKVSNFKSWATFFRIIALISLMIWIESQIDLSENFVLGSFLLCVVWFVHGQVLLGLFVLGHDCGHQTFSNNRMINQIMGHFCFSPLANGLASWNLTHNHHHSYTQLKGQDIDWSSFLITEEEYSKATWKNDFANKLGYALPFGLFFWIWLNAIKRGMQKTSLKIKISNLLMWSVMFALYGSLWYFFGIGGMFKYHGVPAAVAMLTGYFLLTIQHANEKTKWFESESWTPVRGQMEATFDVRFPRVLEWFWLDINIHVPHHVSPAIPWYHLRSGSLALKKNYPELYQERNFSYSEVKWMIKTPKIKYIASDKIFVLDMSH